MTRKRRSPMERRGNVSGRAPRENAAKPPSTLPMQAGTLTILEFDQIVKAVVSFSLTSLGAERLSAMRPLTDLGAVQAALTHTSEATRFLASNATVPLATPDDLDTILARLAIEAQPLDPMQLRHLADALHSVERTCHLIAAASGGPYPVLSAIVNSCPTWNQERNSVQQQINDGGEVSDDASPELKKIRSQLRKQRHRLRGNLESYLRGRDTAKYLQEQIVSERNGRFVLVVRAEHRAAIPGIVHGSSSSGASLFLEPLSTVEVNNEIVALEEQEGEEVRKVLLALSTAFRRRASDLRRTLDVASNIDVVLARASFSLAVDGVEPHISEDHTLELRGARHPLLMRVVTDRLGTAAQDAPPKQPVPVDILMTPPTRALIVTGPNTGGKTVALKTAGLLVLMAQAGLHIPALPESKISVFRSVSADIGDEQSIVANLSTFSGHMSHIVEMDRRLTLPGLILLDEVGAGTDPVEGGALGRAIVDHFRERGAHVIATTHDDALKSYGATTDGVSCAAFGFDPKTFAPTYALVYGSVGRSLALEIAGRLGLDPRIIEVAGALRSLRETQLAEHLTQIEDDRQLLETQRDTLDGRQAALTEQEDRLNTRERELAKQEQAHREHLKQSVNTHIRAAQEEIGSIVDTLRQRAATLEQEASTRALKQERPLSTGDSGALRAEAAEALERVAHRVTHDSSQAKPARHAARPRRNRATVHVGTRVTVSHMGVTGTVRSVHGPDAEVEVNGKRLRVPILSLDATSAPAPRDTPSAHVVIHTDEPGGPLDELNLVGSRVDEALSRVEKHLDQALLGELRRVRIIHGHGTGQLRRAIGGFLKTHPLVRRSYVAEPDSGGNGVTIAELED